MDLYIRLCFWWVVFFAGHSALASTFVKGIITRYVRGFKPYYRLFYNVVSVLLLLPAIGEYYALPGTLLLPVTLFMEIPGMLLTLAGSYILVAGFKNYRGDEFIGTYQLRHKHDFHPTQLNRQGWNGVVRHPLYFGGILLAIGLFLIFPTLKLALTTALVIIYLYIGTVWEEKKLLAEFGETYRKYQQEVSMLIPIKWLYQKLRK